MLQKPSCAYSWGTTPRPCLNPTMPLHAAGMRVEPPPSVATASGTRPAATATAEPPELPPEVRSPRQALRAELRGRGFADDDRAGLFQSRHHDRVIVRDVVFEDQ